MLSEVSQNSVSFSQSFSLGETQFIPQENDELWAVERILAESGKRYLIKWAGVDGNGKEWENSWVPKHDVTNDLIQEWKALKRKESEAKKGRTRRKNKSVSRASVPSSIRSGSKERARSPSARTRSTSAPKVNKPDTDELSQSSTTITKRNTRPQNSRQTRKRKRSVGGASMSVEEMDDHDELELQQAPSPKKRKVVEVISSLSPPHQTMSIEEMDDHDQLALQQVHSPKQRKVAEVISSLSPRTVSSPARKYPLPGEEEEEDDEDEEEQGRKEGGNAKRKTADEDEDLYETIPTAPAPTIKSGPPGKGRIIGPKKKNSTSLGLSRTSTKTPASFNKPSWPRARGSKSNQVQQFEGGKNGTTRKRKTTYNGKGRLIQSDDATGEDVPSSPVSKPETLKAKQPPRVNAASVAVVNARSPSVSALQFPEHFLSSHPLEQEDDVDFDFGASNLENPSSPRHPSVDPEDLGLEPVRSVESPSHNGISSQNSRSSHGTTVPETQSQEIEFKDGGSHAIPDRDRSPSISLDPPFSEPSQVPSRQNSPPFRDLLRATKPKRLRKIPVITPSKFQPFLRARHGSTDTEQHSEDERKSRSSHDSNSSPIKPFDRGDDEGAKHINGSSSSKAHQSDAEEEELTDPSGTYPSQTRETIQRRGMAIAEAVRRAKKAISQPKKSLSELIKSRRKNSRDPESDALSSELFLRSSSPSSSPAPLKSSTILTDFHSEPPQDASSPLNHSNVGEGEDVTIADVQVIVPKEADPEVDLDKQSTFEPLDEDPKAADDLLEEADVESSIAPDDLQYQEDVVPEAGNTFRSSTSQSSYHDDDSRPRTPPFKTSLNLQTPTRQLDAALGLLDAKSDEISELKSALSEQQEENQELRQQIVQLQSDIHAFKKVKHLEKNPEASNSPDSQESSDLRTLRESWEAEKEALIAEISVLKISLDDLRRDQQSTTEQERVDELAPLRQQLASLESKNEELTRNQTVHLKEKTEWQDLKSAMGAEIASLKDAHVSLQQELSTASASSVSRDALTVQIEALRAELQGKEEGWSKEKEKLTSDNVSLTREKDDALQEGAFLREHYTRISAQVNDSNLENEELRKRAERAEKQVISGLTILRADYKGRVEKLTQELDKSKGLLALLNEKDRRTNDAIRQKAASVPALTARIESLQEELDTLREDMGNLVRHRDYIEVERVQVNASLTELRAAHEETVSENKRMNVAILRHKAMEKFFLVELGLSSSLDDTEPDAEGDGEDPDEEEVFKCEWCIDDEARSCDEVFRTKQGLQYHLFSARHI